MLRQYLSQDTIMIMYAATAGPPAVQDLRIDALSRGERVLVTVRGELDISTDQTLKAALRKALRSSTRGVDLDLSGTTFCDCAGLNVLMTVRRCALDSGKTFTIGSASPAVRRLLTATGTGSLFEPEGQVPIHVHPPAQPNTGGHTPGELALNPEEQQELRSEVVQLRRAMQTRPVIDQARGVLMAAFALSPEDAWNVLVSVSQNTNTKLHRLADELVTTVQGGALSEAMQQHMAAAVAELEATQSASDRVPSQPEDGGHETAP